jgi:PAS domain S-box-containing protein
MQGNPVFDAHPSPTLVLDTRFVIRAANTAYLRQTGRTAEDILGRNVFDAFPDNPDDPDSDGPANLRRSLQRVLRTGREHHMAVQRYDVPESAEGGPFVKKYWAPVNSPIIEDRRVIGILHRVEDVTYLEEGLQQVLVHYGSLVDGDEPSEDEARRFTDSATAFVAEAQQFRGLTDEVLNLRRALSSRSTIEQAKGMVMADRRCGPDEAFQLLVDMSNQSNVKLADVAAALVYQAQGPVRRGPESVVRRSAS